MSDTEPHATPKRKPQAQRRPNKPLSKGKVFEIPLDGGGTMRIDSQGRILCKVKRRDGSLCMGPVVAGLRVCRMHGASAPNARLKSRQALADLVDPAIRRLGEILDASDPESRPKDADVLRAVSTVLDRTGFGPSQTVQVEDAKALLYERLLAQASDDEGVPEREDMWTDDEEGEGA